jgi:phage-related protein
MPRTKVRFYRDISGKSPILTWLRKLRRYDPQGYAKCVTRVQLLSELGYELRRPIADLLRDGIHELRIRRGRLNYRILYFFLGKDVAILSHALTKADEVPDADIERAITRRKAVECDPKSHTIEEILP